VGNMDKLSMKNKRITLTSLWVYFICFPPKVTDLWWCRGRYGVELNLSFLRLQGQANDFKIQYSSIVRLFILPKVRFVCLLFTAC
jgi:hypothetical protein